MMQQQGRGNDTVLAHITPAEAALLKKRGGAGTRNPVTGLLEFDDGGGGDSGGGDGGGGNGSDGGGGDSGGGTGDNGGYGDGSGFADGGSYGTGPEAGFGGFADDGFGGGPTGSFGTGYSSPSISDAVDAAIAAGAGPVGPSTVGIADYGLASVPSYEAVSATPSSGFSQAFPGLSAMGRIASAVMQGEEPPDLTEQEGFGLVNSVIGGPVGMLGMGLTGLATAAFGPPTGPAGEGLNNANGNEMGSAPSPGVGYNLPSPLVAPTRSAFPASEFLQMLAASQNIGAPRSPFGGNYAASTYAPPATMPTRPMFNLAPQRPIGLDYGGLLSPPGYDPTRRFL